MNELEDFGCTFVGYTAYPLGYMLALTYTLVDMLCISQGATPQILRP